MTKPSMNCNLCKHGELYPDGTVRCSLTECKQDDGLAKLWVKPKEKKGK